MRRMKRDSFEDLFDQMQNLFSEFQDVGRDLTGLGRMPVDIHEQDGEIVVKADLPGVEKQDINLKADEDTLEIAAESSEEVQEENEKYFRRERSKRTYRRTISWPATVDTSSISAEYEDGVLTVTATKEDSEGLDIEIE